MAKEKINAQRPVPSSGGIKDGSHSVLSTPKKDTGGRYWSGAGEKGGVSGGDSVMK